MSLIDESSCDCVRGELEFFSVPPTQTSITSTRYERFYPLTSVDLNGPLEFRITTATDDFIDPENIFIHMSLRILDENGASLPAETENQDKTLVYPVNNLIGSIFRGLEVNLNSKQIGDFDSMYPYKHYFINKLTFSSEVKKHALTAGLYYEDVSTDLDVHEAVKLKSANDKEQTKNKGVLSRYTLTKESKLVNICGKLYNEILSQSKFIPNKMSLDIKLHRSDSKFVLMAVDKNINYQIHIEKAYLSVPIKKIASHVRESIEKRLLSSNIKIPVRKISMRFNSHPAGSVDIGTHNLHLGTIPRRIILGYVKSHAFNGDLHLNPFNFENFNISSIALRVNGVPTPFEPINMDFRTGEITEAFEALNLSLNLSNSLHSNGISLKNFRNGGSTIFGFNLAPDEGNAGNYNLVNEGHVSLDVRLNEPLTSSVTMVCYLEFDSIIEIDSNRTVFFNE